MKWIATWFHTITASYTLAGALFGSCFPLLATFLDLVLHGQAVTLGTILQAQYAQPLHWIIDTTPLFLGLFAGFASRRRNLLTQRNEQLQADLTAHTRMEEALRESEENYRRLVENSPYCIHQISLEGQLLSMNKAGLHMMALREEREIVTAPYLDVVAAKDRARISRLLQAACTGEASEFEFTAANGRIFQSSFLPISDTAGRVIRLMGLTQDITERKRAECALASAVNEHAHFLRVVPDIVYQLDLNGDLRKWNPPMEMVTGLSPEELRGRSAITLFPEEEREAIARAIRAGLVTGLAEAEGRLLRKEGVPVLYHWTGAALTDDAGNVIGLTGIGRDIAVRKQVEAALQSAKEAAEAANRAKSEFLANMSHEIRTPMNGILGMNGLLLDTALTPEQREYATTVHSSAEALLGVLNDILDFSKIEAGKLEVERVEFSLRESLGDALKALALRAHEKGVELLYEVKPDAPDSLVGDPIRLRQVLVNLVGNAIKFTEQGEVAVQVEQQGVTEEEVRLHVRVTDTGIGIPPDKQQHIFVAFSQADTSTTRQYGGTGLGLSISQQLVELMGGQIWVESVVGQGSTFHFTVRLGRGQALTTVAPFDPGQLHGLPVLVVDDNATNRRILQALLSSWRMRPVLASSAQEALCLLHEAKAQGSPFPLILTDVHMPEMDGFTLVERLKQNPALTSATILMLTSAERKADVARCRQLGIAVYLMKPIKPAELQQALARALGQEEQGRGNHAPLPRTRPGQRSLHILLAEDNAVNQKLALRLLEKRGHAVMVVGNGKEALAALEQKPFDLVLMDVQMPEMDGLTATAAIRAQERVTRTHIPIIALTAHAMKGDQERCLAAGMDDYVTKPLKADELFATLERLSPASGPLPGEETLLTPPVHAKEADSVEL